MNYELYIEHNGTLYQPVVLDTIQWETRRKGSAGVLEFKVINDDILDFSEGDSVRLTIDGQNIFFGFVFKKRRDKEGIIEVTAYDQLRYLKNKDTYVYENKKASEVINMIAGDFNLQCGQIADTGFVIDSRIEDNQTLFDIIQNSLDITLKTKNEMFVLYDDFGKLTLRNISDMKLDILIDEESGENFSYTSSIDDQTYNKVKLIYENKEAGKREIYIAQDSSHINEWGVLQFFESISDKDNAKVRADGLLKLYNQKSRYLTINGVIGDTRVRAGSLIGVSLNLGDIIANSFMLVEQVTHTFEESSHTMNITLRGGEFIE